MGNTARDVGATGEAIVEALTCRAVGDSDAAAAKEDGNLFDFDSDSTKLMGIVEIGQADAHHERCADHVLDQELLAIDDRPVDSPVATS